MNRKINVHTLEDAPLGLLAFHAEALNSAADVLVGLAAGEEERAAVTMKAREVKVGGLDLLDDARQIRRVAEKLRRVVEERKAKAKPEAVTIRVTCKTHGAPLDEYCPTCAVAMLVNAEAALRDSLPSEVEG